MKRLLSVMLVLVMVLSSTVVFADSGMDVEVVRDETRGNDYYFEMQYSIDKIEKGEVFNIQLPFEIKINDNDIFDVASSGGSEYKLTAKDDFINVRGRIGGSKKVQEITELNPLIVNSKVIREKYDFNGQPSAEPGHDARDPIYKTGEIKGNRIFWSIFIRADETHLHRVNVHDEIGDGQILEEDTVKFSILDAKEDHNVEEHIVNSVVQDVKLTKNSIDFRIDNLNHLEAVNLVYYTSITDSEQKAFENQLQVEGENKATVIVVVDGYSDVTGEKPNPEPTEPVDPDPEKPVDPMLPQVGESYFKIEYLIGLVLIGSSFFLFKKKEK